jgi:serine/threonine-protein kinase RsbW
MPGRSTSNEPFSRRFELRDAREDIDRVERAIVDAAARQSYDDACRYGLRLALGEALTNAFRHGNQDDPAKRVLVDCEVTPRRIVIGVEDEGQGFDPEAVPDPTQDENVEIPAGRGILLMRAYMTNVVFRAPGNRVEMTYEREDGEG